MLNKQRFKLTPKVHQGSTPNLIREKVLHRLSDWIKGLVLNFGVTQR